MLNHKTKKGFSIMEVVISLFVITVGILAAVGLLAKSINDSTNSRNQVIAAGLAQEGTELIRNVRDNNLLADPPTYDTGLGTTSGTCVDVTTDTAGNPALGSYPNGCRLYFDEADSLYKHNSAFTPARFYRRIAISNDGAGTLTITGTVWWSGASSVPSPCNTANKCFSATDILTEQ